MLKLEEIKEFQEILLIQKELEKDKAIEQLDMLRNIPFETFEVFENK